MGGGAAPSDAQLTAFRYVDDNLTPLSADAPSPYAEFKMMPIRMQLVVDQRKIPELLVQCANSTMPVEVKKLAVRSTESSSGGMGGNRSMMGGGMAGGMGGGMGAVADDEENPHEVTLEVHGLIYIYNPPNLQKLGTGTVAEQTVEDAAAPETPRGNGRPANRHPPRHNRTGLHHKRSPTRRHNPLPRQPHRKQEQRRPTEPRRRNHSVLTWRRVASPRRTRNQQEARTMKPKLKFDKKAILDFFVDNGEKILFAGVVVCFLLFVYKAVGRERFDKAPKDLTDAATSARSHIDGCDDNVDKKIVDYPKRIEEISHPIEVEPYEWVTALNTPIIKPPGKRGEPVLYAVEELRGTPGVGCFSGRGNPQRGAGAGAYGESRTRRSGQTLGRVDRAGKLRQIHQVLPRVLQGRRQKTSTKRRARLHSLRSPPGRNHRRNARTRRSWNGKDPSTVSQTEMQRYGGTSAMSADLVAANFRDEGPDLPPADARRPRLG